MSEQPVCQNPKCGKTIPPPEVAAYGGKYCEDCVADRGKNQSSNSNNHVKFRTDSFGRIGGRVVKKRSD